MGKFITRSGWGLGIGKTDIPVCPKRMKDEEKKQT
jgi:hypothetical protein